MNFFFFLMCDLYLSHMFKFHEIKDVVYIIHIKLNDRE